MDGWDPLVVGKDLIGYFAPIEEPLTEKNVKSPVSSYVPRGRGVGKDIDRCISLVRSQ